MTTASSTTRRAPEVPHLLQDLVTAARAGEEADELLPELLETARADLRARTLLALLPSGADARRWEVEIAVGVGAADLLGLPVEPGTPLARALAAGDAEAVAAADASALLEPADGITAGLPSVGPLVAFVDGGSAGVGALLAHLGDAADPADPETARTMGEGRAPEEAQSAAAHLAAIAAIAGVLLDAPSGGSGTADAAGSAGAEDPLQENRLDDERNRIARDLHDLAIQELFAAGMELENLQRELHDPAITGAGSQIHRRVEASVRGIERAVTQIRQIVQSLRRDRPQATLTEMLRHETGMATAGLGFAPSLRLPADAAALDAEVPPEIAEDVVAVVRESLANAARHARASAVAVVVNLYSEGVDRVVQVSVSDNGRGIDPSVTRRSGLANMASRARRHQGWVDAIPLEPGTMISWRVTLPPR